jgi:uncharacterized protein with PQ loop repeat
MSATTWVGFVGTALVIMAYLPQVVHLIKERCSWGISLSAYALWFVAGILICAHALSLNDPVFIVLQGYNVAATATIAVFAKKYKQNICIDHRRLAAAAGSQPHSGGAAPRRSAGSDPER